MYENKNISSVEIFHTRLNNPSRTVNSDLFNAYFMYDIKKESGGSKSQIGDVYNSISILNMQVQMLRM